MDASAQQAEARRPLGAVPAGTHGHPFRPMRVTAPAGAGAGPVLGFAVSAVVTPVPFPVPLSALTIGGS
jgi:hypothetical protein